MNKIKRMIQSKDNDDEDQSIPGMEGFLKSNQPKFDETKKKARHY